MNFRIVILSAMVIATLLLGYRLHRTEQRMAATQTEVGALLEARGKDLERINARLLRSQILQTHLDECYEHHEDTLSSVERHPCRFVCSFLGADELWADELDEAICGDLL